MTSSQPPRPDGAPHPAAPDLIQDETAALPTVGGEGQEHRDTYRLVPKSKPRKPSPQPAPHAAPGSATTFRPPGTGGGFQPAEPQPPSPARTATAAKPASNGFRPDIQGLRAVAVLLVLLSHATIPFMDGGFVGVDVFFVISGFLITSLLVKEFGSTGGVSLAGFFARRARRILPAGTAVLIATLLAAWAWYPVTRMSTVLQDAFFSAVFSVNFSLAIQGTDYLSSDVIPSPFQQYWSLAVEEQFYLVWPLLLIGAIALGRRKGAAVVRWAAILMGVIVAASFILSLIVTADSPPIAYFVTYTRVWELGLGALFALGIPLWRRIPEWAAHVLGVGGLAAIVLSALLYDSDTLFPGYAALLPVLGSAAVLLAGTASRGHAAYPLLNNAPMRFLGDISYSLYLWHWPIIMIVPLAIDVELNPWLGSLLGLVSVGVAYLSYRFIENPLRHVGARKPKRIANYWGFGVGLTSVAFSVAVILTAILLQPTPKTVDLESVQVETAEEESESRTRLEEAAEITRVPDELLPPLHQVQKDQPTTYDNKCHVDIPDTALPDGCVFGAPDGGETVFLVGDSHAAQWFPALETIAEENGWRLVSRTKSACTPVDITVHNDDVGGAYRQCDEWRNAVFQEIEREKPDRVILSSEEAVVYANGSNSDASIWTEGWTRTMEQLLAADTEITVISDTPRPGYNVAECVARKENDVQACSFERTAAVSKPERREGGIAVQEAYQAHIIDPTDWICYEEYCPPIVDNLLTYRDSHHLSTPYVRSLTALLGEALVN
ncbi:acyltransferase family protein [Salininema proteolyticum]|uniref:SGNH hydrolase domain-containing protein n=1 Tax=Salininema proteolyticum TaxID=1607685 RepID=A0ABV8TY08_9ACTN